MYTYKLRIKEGSGAKLMPNNLLIFNKFAIHMLYMYRSVLYI